MNQASYPTLGLYNCEWASYLARIKSKLQYMQGNSIISILYLGALEYNAIDLILFFFFRTQIIVLKRSTVHVCSTWSTV